MKVQNNASIFAGGLKDGNLQNYTQKDGKNNGSGVIFGGGLKVNQPVNKADQMKQRMFKQAMKIVSDANDNERMIDDSINKLRDRNKELDAENGELGSSLKEIKDTMASLKEENGITDDSQEQIDLELRLKARAVEKSKMQPNANRPVIELTEEEQERLANLGEPTEYQKAMLDLDEKAGNYQELLDKNKDEIGGNARGIRMTSIFRMEEHGMVDANKQKDKMMLDAAKQAAGMIVDEAKEHIDEEAEKVKEEVKEKAEKEEEKEKIIEDAKESKEESEVQTEEVKEKVEDTTEHILEAGKTSENVGSELRKLLEEYNILPEEIKGMMVDSEI